MQGYRLGCATAAAVGCAVRACRFEAHLTPVQPCFFPLTAHMCAADVCGGCAGLFAAPALWPWVVLQLLCFDGQDAELAADADACVAAAGGAAAAVL